MTVTPMTTTIFQVGELSMSWNTRPPTRPTTAPVTLPERTRSTVQPGGLPARSSLRRIRSAVSAPEIRRPRPTARSCRGARTRSAKGLSSSLLSSFGALVIASRTARERVTPDSVWVFIAEPTSRIATITRPMPSTKSRTISDLHLDQPAHPEDADGEDGDGPRQHRPPQRLLEHDDHVVVVGEQKVDHEEGRE